MTFPRVLLLDDDALARHFAEFALDGLAIELVACATVAEAVAALQQRPVALVLTDLMLDNESGLDLLGLLQAQPALRSGARLAVCSAGVDAGVRAQLAALDVGHVLQKPTPMAALRALVEECLAAAAIAAGAAPATPARSAAEHEAEAVAEFFAGDRRLFDAYRATCLRQFPLDLRAGAAALEANDVQALRRLTHSLKTVLRTLGLPAAADAAQRVEHAAALGDGRAAASLWPALRSALLPLLS